MDTFKGYSPTGGLWGTQTFGNDTLVGGFANGEYNSNMYLAKADSAGVWQWGLQTFSGGFSWEGAPHVFDITATQSGNCVITGRYNQRGVNFGSIIIPPATQYSTFVAMGGTEPTFNSDITPNEISAICVFPNPFSDKITIEFGLEKAQQVSLTVYNIKGQLVRKFAPKFCSKGVSSFAWDGISDTGKQTQSGVYLIKLKTANGNSSKLIIRK